MSTDYLLLDGCTAPGSAAPSAAPRRRWFSYLCLSLAAAGTLLALTGLAASAAWAVTTDTWYTDFGRFGTALFFHWPGPVLLSGLILLVLAVLLLSFDILFAKQQPNSQSSIEREQTP